jgi:putative oxidoreductase
MQRLFTTFPNSWPGAGLLVLRLTLAWMAIDVNAQALVHYLHLLLAALLMVGLWTPLAALACAASAVWTLRSNPSAAAVSLGLLAISLTLLGPGAWSADARIFGRKRIDIKF